MGEKYLFWDSGDTLIDEDSEVRPPGSPVVVRGELHPGALEALETLKRRGYRMVLVADGLEESLLHLYKDTGRDRFFEALIISQVVGEEKPSPKMFQAAMDALGLKEKDKPDIYMIGNNLKRDIAGANRFGIHSVLMDWSPNYNMEPETAEEIPQFRVHGPLEVVELMRKQGEEEDEYFSE